MDTETDIETLRVSEARELLALIPHRLGFRPRESAVLVSLRPPRGQVGLVLRVDLAHLSDDDGGQQLGRSVVAAMDADGARRVVCVLYVDGGDPRFDALGKRSPAHRAAGHLREAADEPFGSMPVHVVTDTGYLALDCSDPSCCPPGGRSLVDLESTQVGARMVLAGSAVADSRDELVRFPAVEAQIRRSVARVRRRWEVRRAEAALGGAERTAAWREESVTAWRAAVVRVAGRAPERPAPWGRLEAALDDRRVRDAVLVALVPGTGDLPERYVRGVVPDPRDDAAVGQALRRVMDPDLGVPPPEEATRLHRDALEAVVAHGRQGRQAPALTLLAMIAWWQGDGARAQILLATALQQDPLYRLARMLDDLLRGAVGPGWTRRTAA